MKGIKAEELILTTENKVGKLSEISKLIKDNGINIRAISAWVVEDKAFFRLVTSDNSKTREILGAQGSLEEKEVIILDMPDEVGQLQTLTSLLGDNGIDLQYIYGTASEAGKSAVVIFSSSDNDKVLGLIS